ncbi:MAG: single-stranded DNA-binding protein [Candidatus Jorgensenbacteria bacterium]|nr:single-stranded DNA-binding protein [Candidatus Jorgensenbacteria bacterium]
MNLNKVFIIGRLTNDPQLRTTPGGQSVATFSIATNRTWANKQGVRQQDVQYHNIVVWGRQAEVASQFLKKGTMAMIEGRLQTRKWQDKQGQNRTVTEIISERLQLGPRPGVPGGAPQFDSDAPAPKDAAPQFSADETKEELPEINIEDEEIKAEDIPF